MRNHYIPSRCAAGCRPAPSGLRLVWQHTSNCYNEMLYDIFTKLPSSGLNLFNIDRSLRAEIVSCSFTCARAIILNCSGRRGMIISLAVWRQHENLLCWRFDICSPCDACSSHQDLSEAFSKQRSATTCVGGMHLLVEKSWVKHTHRYSGLCVKLNFRKRDLDSVLGRLEDLDGFQLITA